MAGSSRAFKSIHAISHSRKLMVLVPNACYTVGQVGEGLGSAKSDFAAEVAATLEQTG